MDPVVESLLMLVDEAFDKKAWHGTNLRGSLRGLSETQAAWRPLLGRHNIWELTLHAAYWKYAVWRRLTGEKRGSFALSGSNWFARPLEATDAAWRGDVTLLGSEHRRLRAAIAALRASDLGRTAGGSGSRTTIGGLVRGIASHDLYHAGQIQLLKRLQAA